MQYMFEANGIDQNEIASLLEEAGFGLEEEAAVRQDTATVSHEAPIAASKPVRPCTHTLQPGTRVIRRRILDNGQPGQEEIVKISEVIRLRREDVTQELHTQRNPGGVRGDAWGQVWSFIHRERHEGGVEICIYSVRHAHVCDAQGNLAHPQQSSVPWTQASAEQDRLHSAGVFGPRGREVVRELGRAEAGNVSAPAPGAGAEAPEQQPASMGAESAHQVTDCAPCQDRSPGQRGHRAVGGVAEGAPGSLARVVRSTSVPGEVEAVVELREDGMVAWVPSSGRRTELYEVRLNVLGEPVVCPCRYNVKRLLECKHMSAARTARWVCEQTGRLTARVLLTPKHAGPTLTQKLRKAVRQEVA